MKVHKRIKRLERTLQDSTPVAYMADDWEGDNTHKEARAKAKSEGKRVNILRIAESWN